MLLSICLSFFSICLSNSLRVCYFLIFLPSACYLPFGKVTTDPPRPPRWWEIVLPTNKKTSPLPFVFDFFWLIYNSFAIAVLNLLVVSLLAIFFLLSVSKSPRYLAKHDSKSIRAGIQKPNRHCNCLPASGNYAHRQPTKPTASSAGVTNIGALPRRCRPQDKRIGTHGALHSRSAIPRQFNRSLASCRYFRSPSTGFDKALDLKNANLFGC